MEMIKVSGNSVGEGDEGGYMWKFKVNGNGVGGKSLWRWW